ncbi:heparinase II/III family protein [Vallitalea sediminicola]
MLSQNIELTNYLKRTNIEFKKIAHYCSENYLEEINEVIEAANNICNQKFIFNLNWDMEQTHKIVHFENEIDWEYYPENDSEWTYALNRHRYWICLGQAYQLTGDEKYAKTFTYQLQHWIDNVKFNDSTKNTTWRSIEAGLRCEYWLKSFNYFKDSRYITPDVITKFVNSLNEHGNYLLSKDVPFSKISNWGVLENHGLFEVGIALGNEDYIKTAKQRLEEEISIQIMDDGVHWEKSPMYHNEVLHCFLDVIHIGKENNVFFSDKFIKRVKQMALVNIIWKKPNHKEFMQGDSDDFDLRDIITISGYIFNDSILKFAGYSKLDFNSIWELGYDAIEKYNQIEAKELDYTSYFLESSGNYYLRSSWEEDGNLLHFSCGSVGGGHGHCEKLHIDLIANGEDILIDSGRYTYVDNPIRHELKGATGHNTIIVDNMDFMKMTNSWGFSKLATPVKQPGYISDKYDFIQGAHIGYLEQGVYVNRKIIFIKPDIYIISDEMYTSGEHQYNEYFHFNNEGKIEVKENYNKISYKSKKSNVFIQFVDNINMEKISTKISKVYNKIESNTTVKTSFSDNNCHRTFVIDINDESIVSKAAIQKLDVKSVGEIIGHDPKSVEAIKISKNNKEYIVFIAHEETSSNINLFKAEEHSFFGSVVVIETTEDISTKTVLAW